MTADSNCLDLQQLAELTEGPGAELSENRVGKASDYSIERTPKMFMASGSQLQLFVSSGAWQHMNPPGFKRVHRSLIYRRRPDGNPDVHRILANSEDVVKTRMQLDGSDNDLKSGGKPNHELTWTWASEFYVTFACW